MGDGRAGGPSSKRHVAELVLQATAVGGGALYGLGWLFAVRLYGRFGLVPEEVGLTFSFAVVRVAVILGVSVATLFAVVAVSGQTSRLRAMTGAQDVELPSRVFLVALLVIEVMCLATVIGAAVWFRWWSSVPGLFATLAGIVLVGIVVAAMAVRLTNFRAGQARVAFARPVLLGLLGCAVVAALVFSTAQAAEVAADQVAAGREVSFPGFRIMRSRVHWVGQSTDPANVDNRCMTLLGMSEGFALLFDNSRQSVFRIDTQNIALVRGGSACDDGTAR